MFDSQHDVFDSACLPLAFSHLPTKTCTWADFAAAARRERHCDWTIYFRADQAAIDAEVAWALKRPSIQTNGTNRVGETSPSDRALNDKELEDKEKYRENMGGRGVCSLGQNPLRRPVHTRGLPTLYTITKKPDLFYSMEHHRWLTPCELSMVHNMPMASRDREYLSFGAETSFLRGRDAYGLPPRRRNELRHQVGNGMSLSCMGVGWCYIFMTLGIGAWQAKESKPDDGPLIRELKRRRSNSDESAPAGSAP